MKKNLFFSVFSIITIWVTIPDAFSQDVSSWQTSGNRQKLLQKQSEVAFVPGLGNESNKIIIDEDVKYQTVDGFGWTLTQGSAKLLRGLSDNRQKELLNHIFDINTGLGCGVIRIGIGATDLSEYAYTYHDDATDKDLAKFSLEGPDLNDLIPVLKKILAINPNIKIIATPWTPPKWMKTNNNYIGGNLKIDCYASYARYFIKYFEAMKVQGINIWAVTPQNEPHHDSNEPSMYMSQEEQFNFIDKYLGPAIANSEFKNTKIIAWDHNCDNQEYPVYVCKSSFVDGSAFHLYDAGANIGTLTAVHEQTGKNVYFTEQYTGPGNFAGDFAWHMEKVMLGSMNNWAKIALEWNLAANSVYEPHTPSGCNSCLGALSIDGESIEYNVSYYLVAQMSKVVKSEAYRIRSMSTSDDLLQTAFLNPDKSISIVVFNKSGEQKTFNVVWDGKSITYTLNANTAASLIWNSDLAYNPVTSITLNPTSSNITIGESAKLTAAILPEDATNKVVEWTTSNSQVAHVNSVGLVRGIGSGSVIISATTDNEQKSAACTINVTQSNKDLKLPDVYNIISLYSNKGIDVTDGSMASGASIQQWEVVDGGGDNQRWMIESAGNGSYYIKSKYSDLYLAATETDNLVQQTFSEDNALRWNIFSQQNDTSYNIINVGKGKTIDIEGLSIYNGAKIYLSDYSDDANNQKWIFDVAEKNSGMPPDHITKSDFMPYPNPVEDILHVNFGTGRHRDIQIFSPSGKLVAVKQANESNITVNLNGLVDGIYVLKVQDGTIVDYRKIIKITN